MAILTLKSMLWCLYQLSKTLPNVYFFLPRCFNSLWIWTMIFHFFTILRAVILLLVVLATLSGRSAGASQFSPLWPLSVCGVLSSRESPRGLSPAGQPRLPHTMAASTYKLQEEAFQENKPNCVSAWQASVCITLAEASLARSCHMIRVSFNVGGDLTRGWRPGGVVHWGGHSVTAHHSSNNGRSNNICHLLSTFPCASQCDFSLIIIVTQSIGSVPVSSFYRGSNWGSETLSNLIRWQEWIQTLVVLFLRSQYRDRRMICGGGKGRVYY